MREEYDLFIKRAGIFPINVKTATSSNSWYMTTSPFMALPMLTWEDLNVTVRWLNLTISCTSTVFIISVILNKESKMDNKRIKLKYQFPFNRLL